MLGVLGLGLVPLSPAMAAPAGLGAAASPAHARQLQQVTSVEGITEYRLANGLQILLNPDDSKPTTTVNMTYRVGSRHENYGETGMAHLLEHLLFKGSPRHPQVWAEFNKRGFSANGSTWYDRTNYYASFSANEENLHWYLNWQADAMVNSFIARKDLDSEMTVVRNEMEMGENDPGRILMSKTLATMYEWHNYGKSTIGARTDVEGVDITRLQAFYRRYYQPDNATLIVSGKFDPRKVLAWVQEAFGPIAKPQRKLPELYTLDPVQDGERSVTLRRVGGSPLLYVGYHVMPGPHPDFAAVEMLSIILGDTPSGRLHQALTEKQLAAGTFAFSQDLADPGFMLVGAQLAPQQDLDAATQALLAVVESMRQQPVTQAELDRARAKWLKSWELGFADPQRIGVALSESVAQGDWRLFFLLRDRVKAVTLKDVQRVAEQVFVSSNRTVAQYVPTAAPERAPKPERVDVAGMFKSFKPQAAQAQVEAFDASPANIDARTERFSLPSGMKVALLPKATRGQTVRATLTLHYGNEQSLANWGEVPDALAALLDKGSASLTRQQWEDKLDALQAEVGFSTGQGSLTASLVTRREHLPELLRVVGDVLRHPALPAAALEEVRQQALAAIEEHSKEPEGVLSEAMSRHGNPYPKGDVRYAPTFAESAQDWKDVTVARIQAFHAKFVAASHAQIGVVGDFDAEQVRQALNATFGDWRSTEPFADVPDPFIALPPTRMVLKTPDKQNASLSVAQPLPLNDLHPDYPAFMLANHLLGAGGDSRLWRRIREKEGLSYNVYSGVQWNPIEAHSRWIAGAIYAPQNRDKVEAALREEVDKALRDGFTQAEFESGRKGLLSFRRLGRAQDARLAAAWASNLYLDRTFAVAAKVDAALEKLTLDDVNAALRRYLKPAQFVLGVAGDFKGQ
ncbi:MAG: pitrilysin family protein [Aquabacterium sp.]